jgi:ATP-dependent DNA helicase DinG
MMLCDPRLLTRGYGRRILASLPPMRRTREESEAAEFLLALHAEATSDR